MDRLALEHFSDSNYCFPISEHQLKIRFRVKKDDDISGVDCLWNVLQFMYLKQYKVEMKIKFNDELYSYYEAVLESEDPRFSYVFLIMLKDGKKYYYSELGVTDSYDFNWFYLTSFRLPYINEIDIPQNKRFAGDVFYQIFPERFFNGHSSDKKTYINKKWSDVDMKGSQNNRVQDAFVGGDLEGITKKLDYIEDLGIDVVYLTPICESNSNHKYDVIDYLKIDSMFGNDKDFSKLCDEIHRRKMKIVLDLVFNHSSNKNKMFLDVVKNGKKSKFYDFYRINGDRPIENPINYETFGNVKNMPKLNSNNYDEMDYFVEVGKHFITKFGVDGYRLDVANEVSHVFWEHFKFELRKIKPDVILIGECWNNASSYLNSNEFESVMNYPFFFTCKDFYINKFIDAKIFSERLSGLLMRYPEGNDRLMLNLLDSHDIERFYNLCKPNKDLYLLAILTLIGYVGCPMIYYGDEIFMEGGTDPDNRRPMLWNSDNFNGNYYKIFKDIVHLRKNEIFKKGDIKLFNVNKLFVIQRTLGNKVCIIVINNTCGEIKYECSKKILVKNNYKDGVFGSYGFAVFEL